MGIKHLLSILTVSILCAHALVLAPAYGTHAAPPAQDTSRTFPESGKTVSGRFFDYWQKSGGLAQHGYPISDEFMEASVLDGKSYRVQYFERSVFEWHPEHQPPNDVLLSLLGRFRYGEKYPNGAPEQVANNSPDARLFPETGMHTGGLFLDYWNTHGGLVQQGYPISEEFTEVSDIDGHPYTVQYFERAVLELHPENPAPYNVLLSQLGTFRYKALYATGLPGSSGQQPLPPPLPPLPPPPTSTPRPATPTSIPTATRTPTLAPTATRTPTSTATPVKPTSMPVQPYSKVFALGDSVMLGSAAELKRLIPNIEVDATVSRQVSEGISVLKTRRDTGRLGDSVVIHLGNNGTFTSQQFDQVLQLLANVRRVVFVTVKVPRSWEAGDNAVIAAGVKRYPTRAVLVDWHAAGVNHPEFFAKDGFHLTSKGASTYAALIAESLRK
jgi:lysophospholipase L1-like esterase